jgi:hypothetical protein
MEGTVSKHWSDGDVVAGWIAAARVREGEAASKGALLYTLI